MEPELVEGRECGSCNVCCVALTINEPELKKLQGHRCRHAAPDNGCRIYATRPVTCQTFFCGWRRLKWVKPTLRPDQSGVLVRLHKEVSRTTGAETTGVIVTLLTKAALNAEGLAETVGAAIAAQIPVYLDVPGAPGYTSARARINDALYGAVMARDKPAVLEILRKAQAQGKKGPRARISLVGNVARTDGVQAP